MSKRRLLSGNIFSLGDRNIFFYNLANSMQNSFNYYDLLGVPKYSGHEIIKSAFRKIAFEKHPDRNPDANQDEFKLIVEAYNVLSDPDKKMSYDISLSSESRVLNDYFKTDTKTRRRSRRSVNKKPKPSIEELNKKIISDFNKYSNKLSIKYRIIIYFLIGLQGMLFIFNNWFLRKDHLINDISKISVGFVLVFFSIYSFTNLSYRWYEFLRASQKLFEDTGKKAAFILLFTLIIGYGLPISGAYSLRYYLLNVNGIYTNAKVISIIYRDEIELTYYFEYLGKEYYKTIEVESLDGIYEGKNILVKFVANDPDISMLAE